MTYVAGPRTFTGRYALGTMDYVTFNLDQELAGRKSHVQRLAISGDRLTVTDSDGTNLTFAKVGAAPPGDAK